MADPETKLCPFCGETIKAVAVRCRHCHAEIDPARGAADFDRGTAKLSAAEFEGKFLDFAYHTSEVLNAASVAHAVKSSIAEAAERLEDLAARDALLRDVDDEGIVFYRLPGKKAVALVPAPGSPGSLVPGRRMRRRERSVERFGGSQSGALSGPASPQAMAGLLLNLALPGLGSIVLGKRSEGILQLVLFVIGLPLCFVLIGIPLCIGTWGWALSTGIRALNESRPGPA